MPRSVPYAATPASGFLRPPVRLLRHFFLWRFVRLLLRRRLQRDTRWTLGARQPLAARQIVGTPQVPGCQAAVRLPAPADRRGRARFGHPPQPIGEAKAVAHAEIVDRQY